MRGVPGTVEGLQAARDRATLAAYFGEKSTVVRAYPGKEYVCCAGTLAICIEPRKSESKQECVSST